MSGLSATMIPAVEQATGLAFRAIDATRLAPTYSVHARFSASYITGAHAVKVRLQSHQWVETSSPAKASIPSAIVC